MNAYVISNRTRVWIIPTKLGDEFLELMQVELAVVCEMGTHETDVAALDNASGDAGRRAAPERGIRIRRAPRVWKIDLHSLSGNPVRLTVDDTQH